MNGQANDTMQNMKSKNMRKNGYTEQYDIEYINLTWLIYNIYIYIHTYTYIIIIK